jgi:hypothetical protein
VSISLRRGRPRGPGPPDAGVGIGEDVGLGDLQVPPGEQAGAGAAVGRQDPSGPTSWARDHVDELRRGEELIQAFDRKAGGRHEGGPAALAVAGGVLALEAVEEFGCRLSPILVGQPIDDERRQVAIDGHGEVDQETAAGNADQAGKRAEAVGQPVTGAPGNTGDEQGAVVSERGHEPRVGPPAEAVARFTCRGPEAPIRSR